MSDTLQAAAVQASLMVGAARISGYSAEEIIGRHFSQLCREEDRRDRIPDSAPEMARRVGKYEAEGLRVRRDGTTFRANVVINAVHDGAGRLMGLAKVARDLTKRRAVGVQLRQTQKTQAIAGPLLARRLR